MSKNLFREVRDQVSFFNPIKKLRLEVYALFDEQTLLADVHFSISESFAQINGKSEIDNTKGNLTSLFFLGVQALILANFSHELKLNFSGTYLRPSFKAPSGRTLK